MITPEAVQKLSTSGEKQCLTLYINTGASPNRTILARYRNLIKGLTATIPADDRKAFDRALARVTNFLEQYRPTGNSILIFATENGKNDPNRVGWQEYPSRVPVRDEAWWGVPNTNQLLWLLDEYRPYGLLIADQQKVRFLAVRLNEFEEFKEFATEIDTTDWRKQQVGVARGAGAFQKGGHDLEAFNSRFMEHVKGFWRTLHKPLGDLVERYHVRRLVVAGNKSLMPEFVKNLPAKLSACVIAQVPMDPFSSPADAVKRIYPEIEAWERKQETRIVADLLGAAGMGSKAAIGIEPTLKFIQEGRAARLVVGKGYDHDILLCGKCSFVRANANHNCSQCNASEIRQGALASVLPRLVAHQKVPVEIVAGPAAEELNRNGGIGVFLRF